MYDLKFLRYGAKHTKTGNFRSFFALLPPLKIPKIKTLKNEKISWRYHHFTHVSKITIYAAWFLRGRMRQIKLFVILGHFLPFYHARPVNDTKDQNLEKTN